MPLSGHHGLVIFIATVLFAGCNTPTAKEMLAEARTQIAQEHDYSAHEKLVAAIRLDPNLMEARLLLATIWLRHSEYDLAITTYDEAIHINPRSAIAHCNRGAAWKLKGDFQRALADYDHAIQLDPNHSGSFSNRAQLYLEQREDQRAIADYSEAIRLGLEGLWLAEAYYGRGNAWGHLESYENADRDLTEAIRLVPDEWLAKYHFHRGHWRDRAGRTADAIADFERTVELDLQHDWAHCALAKLLSSIDAGDLRDPVRALKLARIACELSEWKVSAQVDSLASAYAAHGSFAEAAHWQRKAIEIASENFDLEEARARLEEYEKLLGEATKKMTTTFEKYWSVTTPASIAAFEQKTGLQLPESYRRFLLTTNGGAPTPKIATVKDQGRVMIGRFFGLRTLQELDEVSEMGDIAWLHSDFCDVMPPGFLPIAEDPGGNLFLLETLGDDAGQVWFWDRVGFWSKGSNENLFVAARDFDTFVASLKD